MKTYNEAFIWHQWINSTKDYHLTIKDIQEMKSGESLKVIILDRNTGDLFDKYNNSNTLYYPIDFFKHQMGEFIKNKDMTGKLIFYNGINHDSNNNLIIDPFEFHIEYKLNYWYPLQNNIISITNPEFKHINENYSKNINEFPLDTRVGWRGPMIKVDLLRKLPLIFY